MIDDFDVATYEEKRSSEQELTFETLKRVCELNGVEFNPEKYRSLGFIRKEDDIYTNIALLFSDQCSHTIKIAVFSDEACTVFCDSREFGGSVLKQIEDTVNYLALYNKTSSVTKCVDSEDKQDYPEEAIREALLNAIIHRDYRYSGSIIINVTERKMEFISLGGLFPGLVPDDIRSGISQPRNKNLADAFHRLRLIDSYGTGIRRIIGLYSDCPEHPRIEVTTNTFKIILPNMNTAHTP